MDEKKNIDRLFQEKFKDHEVFPEASVWKNIENRLMKKKKRRILPLWLRLGGAAAILLLLFSTGFWYYNQNTKNTFKQPDEIIITNTDESSKAEEEKVSNKTEQNITFEDPKPSQTKNKISNITNQNNVVKTPKAKIANKFTSIKKNINSSQQENVATSENSQKDVQKLTTNKSTKINDLKTANFINEKLDSEEIIIAQEDNIIEEKNEKTDIQQEINKTTNVEITSSQTKWSVGTTISPLYYNTLSSGSPIDPVLAKNTKNSDNSFSYGLKVNYKLSNKLSLQSGINTLELGYTTENVTTLISSSLLESSNTNINTNIDGLSVAALSTTSQNSEFNQRSSFDISGRLSQSLSYIEIPVEAKYNVLHKKLGVNVIGGFSTYFLYENKVSVTSFGKSTTLGEASNINSLNFSGNLGLDFDYNLTKKLYINVSPMFKYQFNTFSKNSGGFKPYYLGVYTGLNFRF